MTPSTPQDSQTLTADYVQVRRDDAEYALSLFEMYHRADRGMNPSYMEISGPRVERLRAAINQGQG